MALPACLLLLGTAGVAAPVQSAASAQIERSNAFELPGFMNRFLGSMFVNDVRRCAKL